MKVLGMKYLGHDSGITVIDSVAQEIFSINTERVTRIKHDFTTIDSLLELYSSKVNGIHVASNSIGDVASDACCEDYCTNYLYMVLIDKIIRERSNFKYVADLNSFYKNKYINLIKLAFRDPLFLVSVDFYKMFKFYAKIFFERSKHMHDHVADRLNRIISFDQYKSYDHHLCHVTGAYVYSPFYGEKALSISIDGFGGGGFASACIFNKNKFTIVSKSNYYKCSKSDFFSDIVSIGVIYSNFCVALGFMQNSDEGKVEALAAFGNKDNYVYDDLMKSFSYHDGVIKIIDFDKFYTNKYYDDAISLIGNENLAASIQGFLEDFLVGYIVHMRSLYDLDNICLSGGVAANVIANMRIYRSHVFKNISIFPAMSDDGLSFGAALLPLMEADIDLGWIYKYQNSLPYFGDALSNSDIVDSLSSNKNLMFSELDDGTWFKNIAMRLANGQIGAIVKGRMEYGPRALGNRSIIAYPYNDARDKINTVIKRRPYFQPFCPSVLDIEYDRLFDDSYNNKHMTIAFIVKEQYRSKIPSAVHVDGTARPQYVSADNVDYFNILTEVKKITGYGVLINTSFNLHGRTIVRTVEDAITDFIDCELDFMIIGDYFVQRMKK